MGEVMYLGPDTLMPIASALAAVFGALLIFWRRTVEVVRSTFQNLTSKISRR